MATKLQISKKIKSFIKKVINLHEVQTMIALIDPIPDHMLFMINDNNIDDYIDNSILLKEHGTLCFKDFSRLRGKKEDSSIALSQFIDLYSTEFPDLVEENKSGSGGRATKTQRKSDSNNDRISNEHLTILKSITKQLMKHELAEPFLYPVDSNVFPEYYDVIDNPMDLTTAFEKLPECKTVEQALNNLNQIWENCRKFNQEGAPIIDSANTLSNLVDELVSSKLSDYGSSSKTNPTNTKPDKRRKVIATTALSKAALKKIVQELKTFSYATPFIDPVDLDQAPGYFDYVEVKMDLSTIEANIKNEKYSNSKQFLSDLQLIVSNCEAYNHEDSDIVGMARQLKQKFEELVSAEESNVGADEVAEPAILVIKKSRITSSLTGKTKALSQNVMLKIVQDLKSLPCSFYFLLPVDFDSAPGYKAQIQKPMDLSTVEHNVKVGAYLDHEAFRNDIKLIWANCQLYNHESSEIYQMASTFKAKSEDVIRAAEDGIKEKPAKVLEEEPKRGNRSKPEETVDNVPDVADETSSKLDIYSFENMKNWKPFKLDQLQEQLKKNNAITSEACRYRCAQRAREIKHNARSGFYDKNGVYRVVKVGKIPSVVTDRGIEVIQGYHSSSHIYPHGFKCNVFLRLCLVPENNEPLQLDITENTTPYVDIEFSNNIFGAIATAKDKPLFAISIDNVLVVEGHSGREAWDQVITAGKPLDFFKSLGGKLHRCRSVFNRICCHPDISPFLEQVPFTGNVGTEYYETIKSPMWLREVHNRLKEGVYDCESDFAWDMRLIFNNCMEFNKSNSELHKTAQKILFDFEQLYCFWVHSIQDSNICDLAKGEFNDWEYLRYFDATDPNRHFCRETNANLPESDLIMCIICEDEYSLGAAGVEKKTADIKKNFQCKRCCVMDEVLPFGFLDIPAITERMKPYSKEELATGFQWVPSQDEKLSAGWAQAKAIKQHRATNRFLSPVGNEFAKRDEALKTVADEKRMHESLLADRAHEFQESTRGGTKNSSPRRARRSRNKEQEVDTELSTETSAAAVSNEEGRIIYGKLYDYSVPPGYKLVWYIRSLAWPDPKVSDPETDATRLVKVQEAMLGQAGFFGLHNEDVKRSIESLDRSEMCLKYQYKDAEFVLQELSKEVTLIKDLKHQQQDFDSKVNSILASQKWYWENVEKNLRKKWVDMRNQVTSNEDTTDIYVQRGFKTLFSNNTKQGETLLAVWDFLDSVSNILGENPFTFSDLLESVEKQGVICTYGQVLFDDLCCHLTGMLMQELKQTIFPKKDAKWLKFSLFAPLNVISWPFVAQTAIFYSTRPTGTPEFIVDTANLANDSDSMLRKQIITLVLAHPSSSSVGSNQKLIDIRSRVADSTLNCTNKLVEDLLKFFDDALKQHYPDSREYRLAMEMYKWFCNLLERMKVPGPAIAAQEMETNPTTPIIDPEHPSKPSDNYLNPFDFGNMIINDEGTNGTFKVRMMALDALEKTMNLLRSSDPESWDIDEKCAILSTLVDYGSQAEIFQEKKHVFVPPNNYTDIADIPEMPEEAHEFEYCETFNGSEVCYFSGVSHKLASKEATSWIFVPQMFLENNDINAVMFPGGVPTISGRPVCIESVCNRVLAAREITSGKRKKYDDFLFRILDDLERDVLTLSLGKSTLGRGVPIGQDERGSQYWLLECQAHANFCVGEAPCVLIRNNLGWWGYYSGRHLSPLLETLNTEIPVERVLRETIIIRLYRARYDFAVLKQPSDGVYGSIYDQWVQRHKKLLDRARTLTVPSDVDTMEVARSVSMVEHFWHTFVEVRATLYHSIFQRKFDDDCKPLYNGESSKNIDKRRKKNRESWADEAFDCHSIKGFFRCDGFQSIRNVSCTLTATRIMADPYFLLLYIAMNQKSRVRELLDENNERVQERLREILAEKMEEEGKKTEADDADVSIPKNGDSNEMDVDYQSHINAPTAPTPAPEQFTSHVMQLSSRVLLEPPKPSTPSRPSLGLPANIIQKNKAVEVLHVTSGEVLRIFPRGKDAAVEMSISHSGISLCCNGKQDDFCGFKWRFYTGPPQTFEEIEHLQTPIEELLTMKMSRNATRDFQSQNVFADNRLSLSRDVDIDRFNTENEIAVPTIVKLYEYRPNYPTYAVDRERESKEEILVSNVFVSGRLLKIKSEMINLLYILPERKMTFEDDENEENEENRDSKQQKEGESEDEEKIKRDKAERKRQRRERRAQGLTRVITRIQNAATVRDLYKVLIYLEKSYFDSIENYDFDASMFPSDTNLCSLLAIRLFSIDRCLRYDTVDLIDKVSRPDTAHNSKKLRNKLQFVPKCFITPNCNLSMGHYQISGCNSSCSGSRICENAKEVRINQIPDWRVAPSFVNNHQIKSKSNVRARTYDDDEDEDQDEDEEEEFWDNGRKTKRRRLEDDIETVTPLVPAKYLWRFSTWL